MDGAPGRTVHSAANTFFGFRPEARSLKPEAASLYFPGSLIGDGTGTFSGRACVRALESACSHLL